MPMTHKTLSKAARRAIFEKQIAHKKKAKAPAAKV